MRLFLANTICLFVWSSKVRGKIKAFFGLKNKVEKSHYGTRKIHKGQEAHELIAALLQSGKPGYAGRFGNTEFEAFKLWLDGTWSKKRLSRHNAKHRDKVRRMMYDLTGFFPSTSETITTFSKEALKIGQNSDIMAVWNVKKEEEIYKEHFPQCQLIGIKSFDDLSDDTSLWTRCLAGKDVLVVHPFAETIKSQYKKRELLFKNPDMLPKFNLKTIQAVQSLGDAKSGLPFADWFEALEYMKKQIGKEKFDIALIGCGAYGIFLADHCKRLGKQAVHMGGFSQLLFGIKGNRWPDHPLYNEHWVKPSDNEKPKGFERVEKACYW